MGPVLTSVRERHDTTTRPAQIHPLGDATRSARDNGRTRHRTARPTHNIAEHAEHCKQRDSQNRRTHAPHSTFRSVPQRTTRKSRGPSTCHRAVDHDLDVTAGSSDAGEVGGHAPLRWLDGDVHLAPFGLRKSRPANNEQAAGQQVTESAQHPRTHAAHPCWLQWCENRLRRCAS